MTCMSTDKQYFSSLFVVCNLHEIRIRLTREVSSTQYIPLGKRMHTFFLIRGENNLRLREVKKHARSLSNCCNWGLNPDLSNSQAGAHYVPH